MAESPFELSSERISCLRLSSDAVQASKPLPFEVNPVQLLYPSKVTLAVEPPTSSKVAGLVVPMPTLPFCKIVTAGVEKVVPPTAVEGVISKASLTLYCAPANQLYFVGVPPSANINDDPAPAPVAVNLAVCALAPTTSKRLFGPVVPMPTLPLSKILTLSTFDESDNANALPVPVPAPLTDKIADGDVVPMPTLPPSVILIRSFVCPLVAKRIGALARAMIESPPERPVLEARTAPSWTRVLAVVNPGPSACRYTLSVSVALLPIKTVDSAPVPALPL